MSLLSTLRIMLNRRLSYALLSFLKVADGAASDQRLAPNIDANIKARVRPTTTKDQEILSIIFLTNLAYLGIHVPPPPFLSFSL